MADGSAASPGMFFGSTTNLGFHLAETDVLGIAANGLQPMRFYHRTILATNDNATIHWGRSQSFNQGSSAFAYPMTLASASQTISNNTPIVMLDIGLSTLHVGDTITQTITSWNVEFDKMEVIADAGAISFTGGIGSALIRLPIAKTDVTAANVYGISFTIPDSASVTGAHTNTKFIHFPSLNLGAPSTYYGLYFDDEYNGGNIVSANCHD